MRYKKTIAVTVFCFALLPIAFAFQAPGPIKGQWMIDGPPADGKVRVTLHRSEGGGHFTDSSMRPLVELKGLTRAQMDSAGANARFEIAREAGTLTCEGYFKGGDGSGAFTFSANPKFVSEMQSLGYGGLPAEKVFAMAMHDVTTSFVRDLRGLGLTQASSDDLLAMRIHGVSIEFVKGMKAQGYTNLTVDNLVAMKIHGVTPEFASGMKALGITPTVDQMVALQIHGATTGYVKDIKALGFAPTVDQVVALRIHGVTPDYIRGLQARGLKNLTIDQIVSLKIHGID